MNAYIWSLCIHIIYTCSVIKMFCDLFSYGVSFNKMILLYIFSVTIITKLCSGPLAKNIVIRIGGKTRVFMLVLDTANGGVVPKLIYRQLRRCYKE